MSRKLLLAALLAAASLGAGCAELRIATHMPGLEPMGLAGRQRIRVDREASVLALKGDARPKTEALEVYQREDLFGAIEAFWNRGLPEGEAQPVRVGVFGGNANNSLFWLIAAEITTGFVSLLLGWPSMQYSADVRVVLEFPDGRRQEARGSGTCYAGIFYPGDPEPCALSKAVAAALRELKAGGGT